MKTWLRTNRRAALLAAAAALALALLPAGRLPAQAPQEPEVAINVQPMSPGYLDRTVAQLHELGVRRVRVSVHWAWWNAEQRRDFGALARRFRREGIQTLALITSPPQHIESAPYKVFAREAAVFVRDFLREVPEIDEIQLFNEVDAGSTSFGPGTGLPLRQRGRRYAEVLKVVTPAARSVRPVRIVTSGTVDYGDWWRGLLEAGGGRYMDVAALHIYGDAIWGEPWGRGAKLRAVLREHGASHPIYVTEFGMCGAWHAAIWEREKYPRPSPRDVDQYHLDNWRRPLTEDPGRHAYARVYGFQLSPDGGRQVGNNPLARAVGTQRQNDYGCSILRADGVTPRPTYLWLRDWNRRR